MFKVWTILVLTYVVDGETMQTELIFPSAEACGQALSVIYEPIYEHYPDSMGQCIPTDVVSNTVRPRARP